MKKKKNEEIKEEEFDITDTIEFISKSIRTDEVDSIPVGEITSKLSKLADVYKQALADKDVALEKFDDINEQNYKLMQSNHELLMEKTRPLPQGQNKPTFGKDNSDDEEELSLEEIERKTENAILEIAEEWKF